VDPATATPRKNRPVLLSVLLALALLAGLLSAAWNWILAGELDDAERQNVQLLERLAVDARQPAAAPLMAEVKALHARIAELEGQLGELGVPGYGPAAQYAASGATHDPRVRDAILAQQAKAVEVIFADLFQHLQLSPDQRDTLLKLLVQKQTTQADYSLKLMDPSLSNDARSQLVQQLQAANDANDAQVRDFFNNDATYVDYLTYVQQEPERMEVGSLTESLAGANLPLDPAQADALVNLMYQERSNFKFTQDFYDQTKINPQSITGPAADTFLQEQAQLQSQIADRAASILTPDQMTIFRQNQATMRQLMQTNLNLARQLAGGGQ
jgi:hypothetical protein